MATSVKKSIANSWKQKIDPAFDKLVKFYLQFLEQTGLPSNSGWIFLEEEALKLWEEKGMRGWIRRYEKEMTDEKNTIIKWKTRKNLPEKERNKARRDFQKWLFNEINVLPEDSQEYYKKEFAPFYSKETAADLLRISPLRSLKECMRILLPIPV